MDHAIFMKIALEQAEQALSAGEFPVGCVIAYKGAVLATGVRTNTIGACANEIDHAEIVALRQLSEWNGELNKNEATIYTTMEPCLMCLGAILLSGIGEIVYAYEDVMGGGTNCDFASLTPLYKDRTISIIPNILREESLALFKSFFKFPSNNYWKGSLLAQYTLSV